MDEVSVEVVTGRVVYACSEPGRCEGWSGEAATERWGIKAAGTSVGRRGWDRRARQEEWRNEPW